MSEMLLHFSDYLELIYSTLVCTFYTASVSHLLQDAENVKLLSLLRSSDHKLNDMLIANSEWNMDYYYVMDNGETI